MLYLASMLIGAVLCLAVRVDFRLQDLDPILEDYIAIEVLTLEEKVWVTSVVMVNKPQVKKMRRKVKVKDDDDLRQLSLDGKVLTVEEWTWNLFP